MPSNRGFSLTSYRKIILQLVIINILVLVVGYSIVDAIIQPLTLNSKNDISIGPMIEALTILFVLLLVVVIIILNTYQITKFYRSKYSKAYTEEIFHSTEVEYLQTVRNKIIVGLENIRTQLPSNEIFLKSSPPQLSSSSTMLDHFPVEIRNEIETKIKGKTIFTLIEIAYQDPAETNPARISRSLNIPPSSLSREIKKLMSLNYLETHVSETVLQDARLRNFKITPKGYNFLSHLNDALKMTIDRLKGRGQGIDPI